MQIRVVQFQPRSRVGAVALALGVVTVGGALVVVGTTILLALGGLAVAAAGATIVYDRLTGRRRAARLATERRAHPRFGLDPRLEIEVVKAESVKDMKRVKSGE